MAIFVSDPDSLPILVTSDICHVKCDSEKITNNDIIFCAEFLAPKMFYFLWVKKNSDNNLF